MRPVQPILIVLLITILFLYFGRLRSGMMDRVVVAAFVLLGVVMAAMPNLTTRIAVAVGVGRGVDLFFYMAMIGFGFFGLLLYSRLRDLQNTMTELARAVAIQRVHEPGTSHGPDQPRS
jgi:small membrane protein